MSNNAPVYVMIFVVAFLVAYIIVSALMPTRYECTATIDGQPVSCQVVTP